MSNARNCRTGSRCHSRESRSHGCNECQEESGRGYGRRSLGGRGGEKIGWGRQGAVRLDDPPLRRSREEMDDEMGLPNVMGMMGGRLGGQGGMDRFTRRGGIDPLGRLDLMGRLGGLGGMGGRDLLNGPGEFGRRDLLGGQGPMMGRPFLGSPRSPMFNPRQSFAEDPMPGLRQRNLLRPDFAMENPGQDHFMGARQNLMDPRTLGLGMRSPSLRPGGSFDMHAMDRPRMPYGPFQGSPMHLQNQHPNYRPPYVEDYEGSEMDAEMARQFAMQQQMMMMNGGGANPFFYDEGQYGDDYGGMGHLMGGGLGGMRPGMGCGLMGGGIHQ